MSDLGVHGKLDLGSVLPYVKAATASADQQQGLLSVPPPVSRVFVGSLVATYVVDIGMGLQFVSERDLNEAAVGVDDLHHHAVRNFAARVAEQRIRMPKYHAITPVLFDGNLEVSVMFLDELWTSFQAQFGGQEILAVAPARDIFAFCPAPSKEGRIQLSQLIDRVWPTADHRLTRDFYLWAGGAWQVDVA